MSIRVLVADDQAMVRAGFRMLLGGEEDIEVVAEASNGLEAARRILAADEAARILILTTFDLDEYVYEALRLGAAGFVLKESEPARLLAAITAVASGEMMFSPTVMRRLVAAYLRDDLAASPCAPPGLDELTDREREVLRLVGTGITNADIASRLTVTEGTVKTHLNRVMTKLRLTSRAQAVVMAYESGLVTPQLVARTA